MRVQIWGKKTHVDGIMQDCSNPSALAMRLLQSCTKPSIWSVNRHCWIFSSVIASDAYKRQQTGSSLLQLMTFRLLGTKP